MPAGAAIRLSELASLLGREVIGDPDFLITGVGSLEDAQRSELSFVRSRAWAEQLEASRAGAVIVPEDVEPGGRPAILSPDPSLDFARAVEWLVPASGPATGVHASAQVSPNAKLDPSVAVGANVVVEAGCVVGARTRLHPNVTLYADVEIGADCELHAGVVVRDGVCLGDRVRLQPGVLIGGDGFGFIPRPEGPPQRIPQVGRVVIEDDVEIGAGSTVDRATLGETRIRRGTKIDNLVMVAHNVEIGENVLIVAQSGVGGGSKIGDGAILMARSGVREKIRVGARAFVGARSGIGRDVAPGGRVYGSPAIEERAWHRAVAALHRLPDALRRLRRVERALGLRNTPTPSPPDSAPTDVHDGEGEE